MSLDEKRVSELDVLRGFAMLGVFIVNFVEMNSLPPGESGVYPVWNSALDESFKWLYHTLFNEKFYLIFVFLFGYSLSFIAVSAQKKNLNVDLIVLRRMGSLLLIGVILAGLFWWGVILIPYALFGLIMWGLVRACNQWINCMLAVLLILVVPPLLNHIRLSYTYQYILDTQSLSVLYTHGGFKNWIHLIPVQLQGVYWGFFTDGLNTPFYPGNIAYMSMLLGLFILGWYGAMHKVITTTSTASYCKLILFGIVLFVVTRFLDPKDYFFLHRFSQTLAMSAGIIILARVWESPLTRLFALIGRTSFSAYAFHLMVGALVFYLFGLFQEFSFSMLFIMALATYLMAAITCWAMQRRFGTGFCEMLMKRMTYGKDG